MRSHFSQRHARWFRAAASTRARPEVDARVCGQAGSSPLRHQRSALLTALLMRIGKPAHGKPAHRPKDRCSAHLPVAEIVDRGLLIVPTSAAAEAASPAHGPATSDLAVADGSAAMVRLRLAEIGGGHPAERAR